MSDIVIATRPFHYAFERSFQQKISVISDDLSKLQDAKLVIFSGGEDINPKIYNQKNTYSYFNERRDEIELNVLHSSLKMNKKILGVCRGHQLINACLGGKLVQDLYKDLKIFHKGGHQLVYLTQQNIIKKMFPWVNSMHHQGVIKEGKGLTATSHFKGIIESCENDNIITVQFHPEFMSERQSGSFFNYLKQWKEL